MTVSEFGQWLQRYYGKIPDGQKEDMARYLREKSPEYLDELRAALVRHYSTRWGRPPDVAIMYELEQEIYSNLSVPRYVALPEPEDTVRIDAAEILQKITKSVKV